MATLEKLRQKGGTLVAVVIGLSLLAFILGDFLGSSGGSAQRRSMVVGEINGKAVMYTEFNQRVEAGVQNYKTNSNVSTVDGGTMFSIRSQVWNTFLNEYMFGDEYEKLSIACTPEELFDMVQGRNVHPQVQAISIFRNEVTGEFDPNLVVQFLKNMENDPSGQAQTAWVELEKDLIRDRVYTKYQNLVTKGLFVTKWQIDNEFVESNRKYNIHYVSERFMGVADSLIQVSDAEVQKYYSEHKDEFKQTASRDIEYVAFDIMPSQADRDLVANWIQEQLPEFQRIENPGAYVNLNSDVPFNPAYLEPLAFDPEIQGWLEVAQIGETFGPYQVGDFWKIARLSDSKMLPDSARASHILIQPDATGNFDAAQTTADSLLALIKGGASSEALAAEYGTDGTAQTGGDLNWFTYESMVPEFAEACFFGKKGDLTTVRTQYGWHVVKITDQGATSKKYQVATLVREITASSETIQNIYGEASRFATTYGSGSKFDEGVEKENLTKRVANNIREEDQVISGLEEPRELVRWAYDAEVGDMSDIYQFGNRFIIARLTVVREEGEAPLEQVRGEVENLVRNDKKADLLVKKFNEAISSGATLEDMAARFGTDVKTVDNQYFTSSSITGVGIEPALTAALVTTPVNTLSKPIKGRNGVYVMMVTQVIEPGPDADILASAERLVQSYQSRVGYATFQALEEQTKITDNRNKFY